MGLLGLIKKFLTMQKKKIKISNTKKIFDNSVTSTALGFIFCLSRGIHLSLLSKKK